MSAIIMMKATIHKKKRKIASRATRRDRAAPLPSLNEHGDVILVEGDAVAVVMGIISHRPRADRDTVRGTCLAHRVCTPMSHNGYGTQAPRGVPSKSEGEETPCNRYHYVLYLNRLTGVHCGGQNILRKIAARRAMPSQSEDRASTIQRRRFSGGVAGRGYATSHPAGKFCERDADQPASWRAGPDLQSGKRQAWLGKQAQSTHRQAGDRSAGLSSVRTACEMPQAVSCQKMDLEMVRTFSHHAYTSAVPP